MSDLYEPPKEDIVVVLRRCADQIESRQADNMNMLWVRRAADEIERLREELVALRRQGQGDKG